MNSILIMYEVINMFCVSTSNGTKGTLSIFKVILDSIYIVYSRGIWYLYK